MKAWQVQQHGGLDALLYLDLPTPAPGPGQALVRVESVGLNHLDIWVRKGVPGHKFPLPLTPGCDVAGTIVGFGPGAEAALTSAGRDGKPLQPGAPVLINPGVSCGRCEACLGGF